jgi:hypothetical protein
MEFIRKPQHKTLINIRLYFLFKICFKVNENSTLLRLHSIVCGPSL